MTDLTLTDLCKTYGVTQALKPLNLTIPKGSFTSILGPSGSGKTTLLMLLAGIETPTAGRIQFEDKDITEIPLEKRHVGIVFQHYALFPHLSVRDNILYGVKRKLTGDALEQKLQAMLELTALTGLENRYPAELSGGQQQRVAVARALATDPDILLLDEPLSALDAWTRSSLGRQLRDIQQKTGITTVMVTHDRSEALALSDFIVILNGGELEQAGTPETLYDHPESEFVATFVGGMNIISDFADEKLVCSSENSFAGLGLRFSDVKVNRATEASLSHPDTVIGRLLITHFMGDFIRAQFLLNDFKTEITADIVRSEAVASTLQIGELYALSLPKALLKGWTRHD